MREKLILTNGGFEKYLIDNWHNDAFEHNASSINKTNVIYSCENVITEFVKYVSDLLSARYMATNSHHSEFIIYEQKAFLITVTPINGVVNLNIRYNVEHDGVIKNLLQTLDEMYTRIDSHIKWVYDRYDDPVIVPIKDDKIIYNEMYPFLNRGVYDYFDGYLQSKSSVLLLLGPRGTGKTSFITELIRHSKSSAWVTYNANLIESDSFFKDFICSEDRFLVMEDADTFLSPREDGNKIMHKILNIADGMFKGDKKIIFSTNIEDIDAIDSALTRVGRCYDVLEFGNLSSDEAKAVVNVSGLDREIIDGKYYSLAEIFNGDSLDSNRAKRSKKIGFM